MARERICPVDGCPTPIPRTLAMCGKHWRQVPADLQRALYSAYHGGSLGEHLQAMEYALAAVEGRQPEELFGD